MTDSPLKQLHALGQSIWLDYIHTDLMHSGELARLIENDALQGLTSNPSIFEQAIANTDAYDERLRALVSTQPELDANGLFTELALVDIAAAADVFEPVWRASRGDDGMVSLEVSPTLAHDADATVTEALQLHARLARPNVMIKVPGTKAGVAAFEELTAQGVSVNVTLLFSVERYREITAAHLRGLHRRLAAGHAIDGIASVASFFISRVDTAVDAALGQQGSDQAGALMSTIAIANAKVAWGHYQNLYGGEAWQSLAAAGALPQRLLWASTGTKNPDLPKTHYIDTLIGPDTVNTVPPKTFDAFRDHGVPAVRVRDDLDGARACMTGLEGQGISMSEVTARLEQEGVDKFVTAFDKLLATVGARQQELAA
ncbi:MAG: transaldolase [Pseudomonadota bacterium]